MTLVLAGIGAVLVCCFMQLAKRDPSESLTTATVRLLRHNALRIPVSDRWLVPLLAALPGVVGFGLVLSWQLVRRSRASPSDASEGKTQAEQD